MGQILLSDWLLKRIMLSDWLKTVPLSGRGEGGGGGGG